MNIKQIVGDAQRIAIVPGSSLSAISSGHVLRGFLEQMHFQSKIFVPKDVGIPVPIPGREMHLNGPQVEQMLIGWPWDGEALDDIQSEINQESGRVTIAVDMTGRNSFPVREAVEITYQNWEPDLLFLLGDKAEDHVQLMSFLEGKRVIPWHEDTLLDAIIGLWTNQVWDIDQDLATHLLVLVDEQTDLLQKGKISPEVFELVSACIRADGKRLMLDHKPQKQLDASKELETPKKQEKQIRSNNPTNQNPEGQQNEETKKQGYVIPDWLRAGVS